MNANDPAFPIITPDMPVVGSGGLTKRELIAAMMTHGLISSREFGGEIQRIFDPKREVADAGDDKESPQAYTSRVAIAMTDALIAELSKEQP